MKYEWIKLRYTFEGVRVEEKWVRIPITGNKEQDEQYEHFLADYLSPKVDCSEVGRSKTKPANF
tara:strand:+ start:278 stop:469 length:192 start_codon:yes stop_codon:yes gene_type:complete